MWKRQRRLWSIVVEIEKKEERVQKNNSLLLFPRASSRISGTDPYDWLMMRCLSRTHTHASWDAALITHRATDDWILWWNNERTRGGRRRREMRQIWKGNQRRDETEDGYLVIWEKKEEKMKMVFAGPDDSGWARSRPLLFVYVPRQSRRVVVVVVMVIHRHPIGSLLFQADWDWWDETFFLSSVSGSDVMLQNGSAGWVCSQLKRASSTYNCCAEVGDVFSQGPKI